MLPRIFSILLLLFLLRAEIQIREGLATYSIDVRRIQDFSSLNIQSRRAKGFSQPMNYGDIQNWAAANNLAVADDSPDRGIRNGLCAFIGQAGATIELEVEPSMKTQTQGLLLDFVRFKTVNPKENPIFFQRLVVYVNDHYLREITFGFQKTIDEPIVIEIDPQYFPTGELKIELRPSISPTMLWALWDVSLPKALSVRGD